MSVLLVDDDLDLLYLLARALRESIPGAHVLLALSGQEGVRMLTREAPTLVAADFSMPGMNGLEFLEHVQATHPNVIRVLHTGLRDEQLARLAQDDAGASVVWKHADPKTFVDAVRSLLLKGRQISHSD